MSQKTMKALVYHGPNNISLSDVMMPTLQKPTDVIGRVTLSTICTSDIHIAKGHIPLVEPPRILGHEFCIEIVEKGDAVVGFEIGQHVHVTPLSFCGECPNCKSGRIGRCINGGGFGIYSDGCQAEYIRVPNANSCLIPIPDGLSEEDVLLVGDMLATAWFGIKKANVQQGQTVAVVGLGPVGFCSCMLLKKAFGCRVIAITRKQESLNVALKEGIADETVNASDPKMLQKVMALTNEKGADVVIETAGTSATLNNACAIAKYEGCVSTVSVFDAPVEMPMNQLVYKNLNICMGIQRAEGVPEIFKLIKDGTIDTKFILTHKAPLNDIIKGYDVFGGKSDGCIKWVVTPYER